MIAKKLILLLVVSLVLGSSALADASAIIVFKEAHLVECVPAGISIPDYPGTADVYFIHNVWYWGGTGTQYGSCGYIGVGNQGVAAGSGSERRGLIRFDVSSLAGKYDAIKSIKLRFYVETDGGGGGLEVFRISDATSNWQEGYACGGFWSGGYDIYCTSWDWKDWAKGGTWVAGGCTSAGGDYDLPALGTALNPGGGVWAVDTPVDVSLGGGATYLKSMLDDWSSDQPVSSQTAAPDWWDRHPLLNDNEGLLLAPTNSTHVNFFHSAQAGVLDVDFKPELIVDFIPTGDPYFTLTMQVDPAAAGTTSPPETDHVFDPNEVVNLDAFPDLDHQFDHWTGGVADPNAKNTTVTMDANKTVTAYFGPGGPRVEALEVFYNGKFANVTDPAKSFLALAEASSMSVAGDDLHGNVTNYANGITGLRVTFRTVVTFAGAVSAAFSYEATPEQSSDKTFTAFTPPTAPGYAVDDSTGKTIVTITFTNGEIKNRWLKTIILDSQVSFGGVDLDGEIPSPLTLPSGDGIAGGNAEFIIGNRLGDVDANYRCLLNDAIAIRNKVSGVLVGISNVFDIDKNERVLLNEAIGARNAVSGTALPTLP